MKKYRVILHFNRNNMQQKKDTVWTVKFRGICYQVEEVIVKVPMMTRFKPDGPQPRALLIGWAKDVIGGPHHAEII